MEGMSDDCHVPMTNNNSVKLPQRFKRILMLLWSILVMLFTLGYLFTLIWSGKSILGSESLPMDYIVNVKGINTSDFVMMVH